MSSIPCSLSKLGSSTTTDESFETNIVVKLRRLKIEENLLTKSIGKTIEDLSENEDAINQNSYSETQCFYNKLKKSYIEIRDLFEEVKASTSSEDNLQSLDIDDVKKDVLTLETKMKTFKIFLHSQLKILKTNEEELIKQIERDYNEVTGIVKTDPKIQLKPFNEIIPSPVKALITSPFKCQEVQQLQEFMLNSKNRYQGWISYNHNIFEQTWQKYFSGKINSENLEDEVCNIEHSEKLQLFIHEVCNKIPGTKVDDVISHSKWYAKYIYLKERQQIALEKWKMKKQLIKRSFQSSQSQNGERKKTKTLCQKKLADTDDENLTYVSDEVRRMKKANSKRVKKNISTTKEDKEFQDFITKTLEDVNISSEFVSRPSSEVQVPAFVDKMNKSSKTPLTYRNPTKQWIHRCSGAKDFIHSNMDIENIGKRFVPTWRLTLAKE